MRRLLADRDREADIQRAAGGDDGVVVEAAAAHRELPARSGSAHPRHRLTQKWAAPRAVLARPSRSRAISRRPGRNREQRIAARASRAAGHPPWRRSRRSSNLRERRVAWCRPVRGRASGEGRSSGGREPDGSCRTWTARMQPFAIGGLSGSGVVDAVAARELRGDEGQQLVARSPAPLRHPRWASRQFTRLFRSTRPLIGLKLGCMAGRREPDEVGRKGMRVQDLRAADKVFVEARLHAPGGARRCSRATRGGATSLCHGAQRQVRPRLAVGRGVVGAHHSSASRAGGCSGRCASQGYEDRHHAGPSRVAPHARRGLRALGPGESAQADFLASSVRKAWLFLIRLMHSGRDTSARTSSPSSTVTCGPSTSAGSRRTVYDNLAAAVRRVSSRAAP